MPPARAQSAYNDQNTSGTAIGLPTAELSQPRSDLNRRIGNGPIVRSHTNHEKATQMLTAAVIGAGSFGTTIAQVCARNVSTKIWVRPDEAPVADEINTKHTNSDYLGDAALPESLVATTSMSDCVDGVSVVAMAIPSVWIRNVAAELREVIPDGIPVVSLVKGLEEGSRLRMTELLSQELPGRAIGALSGPNIAKEVVAGIFSASVLAFEDVSLALALQPTFNTSLFRVYVNQDVIGVEVAGALKNVIAIAAGISDGGGGGDNARATIITRGLVELTQIGMAMGAKAETFTGLAGLGDLIATCTSTHSRNHHVGAELGRGRALDDILSEMKMVAEGVKTARVVPELANDLGVDTPISDEVRAVVDGVRSPLEALKDVVTHRPGHELEPD